MILHAGTRFILQTSLELAIKYDVRSEIVKVLLQAGAQPVIRKPAHESALIIAAKQSSALLPRLVNHVKDLKLLDQVDSEGKIRRTREGMPMAAFNGKHNG